MENYYLGLDLGTDSIGWAVTDKNYNIPKFKGNSMWGIRLLEGGNTAVERREFRSSRRRLERNKYRLNCLEMLFNEEISKKDIAFSKDLRIVHSMMEIRMFLASILCSMILIIQIKIIIKNIQLFII